jgi:hypothetical protein
LGNAEIELNILIDEQVEEKLTKATGVFLISQKPTTISFEILTKKFVKKG